MNFIKILFFSLTVSFLACNSKPSNSQLVHENNPSNIDLCDDPDADIACCFINLPANITPFMQIAADTEPGDKLRISGTIYKSDGITPYSNVILYAYQTDNTGHYTKNGNEKGVQKWHGRLHGWCKTNVDGRYEIITIRPARYPDNSIPAHLHCAVKTPDNDPFYINDFVFKDDNLVNEKYLNTLIYKGGNGVLDISKEKDGVWQGVRDIILD